MKCFILSLFLFISTCDFPKDPEDSFEEAYKDRLKVGVSVNPPYIISEDDSLWGSEIDLINNFAKMEGLKVEFTEGSESDLVKKLENFELHLMAGGFDKKTMWKKKVGTTAPYEGDRVLFVARGENKLLKKLEKYIFQNKQK